MPESSPATDRGPSDARLVINGLRLAVSTWGPDGGAPLLLLHGGGCSSADWAPIASGLSRRFRVLAPDQRGHGHTQWAESRSYPVDDLVADAAELLRRSAGSPAALVGHSMGAVVALVLAARHPELVTRLVLVDGGPWRTPSASRPAP